MGEWWGALIVGGGGIGGRGVMEGAVAGSDEDPVGEGVGVDGGDFGEGEDSNVAVWDGGAEGFDDHVDGGAGGEDVVDEEEGGGVWGDAGFCGGAVYLVDVV